MSYPHFPLEIRLTVTAAQVQGDCVLVLSRLLPFAPYEGVKLRLWREDDEVLDLTLEEPVYSFHDSAFIVELEDNEARESFRNHGEGCTQKDLIEYYVSFGFKRITYPQGQAIRKES